MAVAPLQLPGYQASRDIDWAPLDQLGKTIKVYRDKAALGDIMANADFSNPQSLHDIAKQAYAIDPSTGMTLANLGTQRANTIYQQGRDEKNDAWRREESERAQRNADRSYGLQARAAARADETALDKMNERASVLDATGIDRNSPQGRAYLLTGRLSEESSLANEIDQRRRAAASLGLDPGSPGYQSYALTGKMPREDAQPLTATDKKAILEADELVQSTKSVIGNLEEAKKISSKAFSGPAAGARGYAASFLGNSSDLGKAGIATTDLNNLVTTNALTQLKAIFGGNPTEGERAIILDIQGSSSQPDAVRQKIFDRAIQLAQRRLEFNYQKANELRGGQYYKTKTGNAQDQNQNSGITQQQYDALPSGSVFVAPDGTRRVKP